MKRAKMGPHSGRAIKRLPANDIARFWSHVRRGPECWIWTASRNVGGYGQTNIRQYAGPVAAHRVSYAIRHGSCPANLVIRHLCDTPACVNPRHLLVGTQRDNYRDAIARGRAQPKPRSVTCKVCGGPRDLNSSTALCVKHRLERINARRRETVGAALFEARLSQIPGITATFAEIAGAMGERKAEIFAKHFGLFGYGAPRTLTEMAPEYGISRERVRQIVVRVCRHLEIEPRTFWGRKAS